MSSVNTLNAVNDTDESTFATQPYSWKDVLNEIKKKQFRIKRSHEVELAYAEEKKKIGQEWDSMSSCCKHVFLHCPFKRRLIEGEKNESEKLKTVDDDDIRPCTTFCLNNFPYFLEEEMKHYVIWSTAKLRPNQYRQLVEMHYPLVDYDVIICESPPKSKSVPNAHHVHALVRPRKTGICFVKVIGFDEETTYG